MIVRNNRKWTRLGNRPTEGVHAFCPAGTDFAKFKTVRLTYFRSKRDRRRRLMIELGRY